MGLGRSSAWLDKAWRMGLGLVEHDRRNGHLVVRGKVNGVEVTVRRLPKRDPVAPAWDWTLAAHAPAIDGRIAFTAERTGLARIFGERDHTSGDATFDAAVRLSGESNALCAALTQRTRRQIMGWTQRGGVLAKDTLTLSFRASAHAAQIFDQVKAASRLMRRLEKAVFTDPKRLMQIAVHDVEPGVRLVALKHALALYGGPLSPHPEPDWIHGPALYQTLVAAAHSDDGELIRLGGIHLAAYATEADCAQWSESMLIAVAEHGQHRGTWQVVVSAMAETGGQRCLNYLVDYAEGWFGLRKGAKHAERAIATLMNRLGGDAKGGLSVLEPLADGAISLIAPLPEEDD